MRESPALLRHDPPHNGAALSGPRGFMPENEEERIALLQQLLGEGMCRQLGIFPLPKDLKLSVVVQIGRASCRERV